MFKLDNFGVILFVSFSYKNCYNVHFMKILKIDLKIQKSLCITTTSLLQIQNFKHNYLKNYNDSEHPVKTKNAPFFMIFPNINSKLDTTYIQMAQKSALCNFWDPGIFS